MNISTRLLAVSGANDRGVSSLAAPDVGGTPIILDALQEFAKLVIGVTGLRVELLLDDTAYQEATNKPAVGVPPPPPLARRKSSPNVRGAPRDGGARHVDPDTRLRMEYAAAAGNPARVLERYESDEPVDHELTGASNVRHAIDPARIPAWVRELSTYRGFEENFHRVLTPTLAQAIRATYLFFRRSEMLVSVLGDPPLYELLRSPTLSSDFAALVGFRVIATIDGAHRQAPVLWMMRMRLGDAMRVAQTMAECTVLNTAIAARWRSPRIPLPQQYRDPWSVKPAGVRPRGMW